MDNLVKAYNYDRFVPENFEPWMRFEEGPPLGVPAPDFSLTNLDGKQVRLAEVWPRSSYTIVEFGSLT